MRGTDRRSGATGRGEDRRARGPADEAAYDAFFARAWGPLQGQAYVLTGSLEQAQDLTQEALLRAWTHWERIAGYEDPVGWTRRVLHNLCIQSWRKSQVRRLAPARAVAGAAPVGVEEHVVLAQALRRLPAVQARALLLHDGLGMTVPETARELDVPEGTVKSWLSRARKHVSATFDGSLPAAAAGGDT